MKDMLPEKNITYGFLRIFQQIRRKIRRKKRFSKEKLEEKGRQKNEQTGNVFLRKITKNIVNKGQTRNGTSFA